MPLVERSHLYERVQLAEYYQNITVTHLDHFWNLTPLYGVSGSVYVNLSNLVTERSLMNVLFTQTPTLIRSYVKRDSTCFFQLGFSSVNFQEKLHCAGANYKKTFKNILSWRKSIFDYNVPLIECLGQSSDAIFHD